MSKLPPLSSFPQCTYKVHAKCMPNYVSGLVPQPFLGYPRILGDYPGISPARMTDYSAWILECITCIQGYLVLYLNIPSPSLLTSQDSPRNMRCTKKILAVLGIYGGSHPSTVLFPGLPHPSSGGPHVHI